MDNKPRTGWLKGIALAFSGLVLIGCQNTEPREEKSRDQTAFEEMTGHVLVEPSGFLDLRPGVTRRETIDLLGTAGRHLFTYQKDGSTYLLTTYFIRNRPETESGIAFYGLFKDDSLLRILRSLPKSLESYPYRGTTASRPKTWRVEDESRIDEILSLPGQSRREIGAVIDRYSQPRPKSGPQIPLFIFEPLMTLTGYKARIKRGFERNLELLRQFDGLRIELGMSIAEVNALLGKPAHNEAITSGLSISIFAKKLYGDAPDERLEISPFYRFSPVAVVFDDGRAARVYSKGFISRDWMPNGTEYGL